jgi:hypothetical protein
VAVAVTAAAPGALALQWPPLWGWGIAIAIVVLGGIIVTSVAGPHLAAVGVTPDDRLLVRPVGLMRVWALTRGSDVPITSILEVGVHERRGLLRGSIGWRTPGTYLPGFMVAGTYRSKGEKDLWMVGRAKQVLVIELSGEAYRRVVVQVEDPEAATEALRAAMLRER